MSRPSAGCGGSNSGCPCCDISKPNPDPSKFNGATVWPNRYTLEPSVWNITDPYETEGKSKSKRIAIVEEVDDKGIPNRFRKIRVTAPQKGIFILDLNNSNDYYTAFALELHPKLNGGKFEDKNSFRVVTRVDENAEAEQKRMERTARKKALDAAESMTDKDIMNFADAMMWDSGESPSVLRNKVEEMALKTAYDSGRNQTPRYAGAYDVDHEYALSRTAFPDLSACFLQRWLFGCIQFFRYE